MAERIEPRSATAELVGENPDEVKRRFSERILAGLENLPALRAAVGFADELFLRDTTYAGNRPLLRVSRDASMASLIT